MKLKLTLTKDDVEWSQFRGSCTQCPIAKAINDQLSEGFFASVYDDMITVRKGTNFLKSKVVAKAKPIPKNIAKFIEAFDSCKYDSFTYPLKFEVELV